MWNLVGRELAGATPAAMLLAVAPFGYSVGPSRPGGPTLRTLRMQQEPPPRTPHSERRKKANRKVQATGISEEVDQFLEEAEEFISQVQTGAFDRKIAKIVANSETRLLDRFISVGRNALSVLTRVSRHGQSAPARVSPCAHPALRDAFACSWPSSGERRALAAWRPKRANAVACARLLAPQSPNAVALLYHPPPLPSRHLLFDRSAGSCVGIGNAFVRLPRSAEGACRARCLEQASKVDE